MNRHQNRLQLEKKSGNQTHEQRSKQGHYRKNTQQ